MQTSRSAFLSLVLSVSICAALAAPVASAGTQRSAISVITLWSGALGSRGTAVSENEVVFDAETLRFYLEPAREYLGPSFDELSENLQGATLRRKSGFHPGVEITLNLKKSVALSLQDPESTDTGGVYGIIIPKRVEYFVSIQDDVLKVQSSFLPFHRLVFLAKIPVIPDTVWLKSVEVNLSDAKARIVATILGSTVAVVAEAQLTEGQADGGIDVLETILLNLILAPGIVFGPLK